MTLPSRPGRLPSTSREELEQICLSLFTERGFDAVSVDEVARAAGIGRRTFFRYFPSKNDVVWGDFDHALEDWERWFASAPRREPIMSVIRRAVLAFNTFDPSNAESHRGRMRLILHTDALQAHSTLRYADWRHVVARFAAARLGLDPQDRIPQLVGQLTLGAALTAYEQWLSQPTTDLLEQLDQNLRLLERIEPALGPPAGAR